MNEVNYWLIMTALSGLEERRLRHDAVDLDPDNASDLRNAFAASVLPRVDGWSAFLKDKLRRSLAYYLHKPEILLNEVLGNLQDLNMPEPADVVSFFRILWDVLYPSSRWENVDIARVKENNDIMEINKVHER